MTDPHASAPRSILLPAVLQVEGQAPCFGTIANLSDQGLAFDFQSTPLTQQAVGLKARLDFDDQNQHHSCKGLIVHIQGQRALLSLRDVSANILAALHPAHREGAPSLATRLSTLQIQQACHTQFMNTMKAVVDDFYERLPAQIQLGLERHKSLHEMSQLNHLQTTLAPLRPHLTRQFTQAYPMYPELRASYSGASTADTPDLALVDMERVDDWIRRTTIAQKVAEAAHPLPDEFNRHYKRLLGGSHTHLAHPYHADAVLDILSDLIAPLGLGPNVRALCYETMGQAFQKQAHALYQAMLRILGDAPSESPLPAQQNTSLEEWLQRSAAAHGDHAGESVSAAQVNELTALLGRLTENLGDQSTLDALFAPRHPDTDAPAQVPGLLARDRIFSRFLPAFTGFADTQKPSNDTPASRPPGAGTGAIRTVLGGLSDLDEAAWQGLQAFMRQPLPIDPGPESLPQASQVRTLMQQAQALLLEYTANGLTYQAQPDHPAWALINALDALHQGADNQGQFLNPALHQAVSLTMQWLLGQENLDAALGQANALFAKINLHLRAERQARRAHHLKQWGTLVADATPVHSGWCVVKHDDEAIPYEVLGAHDDTWLLLDRSATSLLELPAENFLGAFDSGQIEAAKNYNAPFLERTADATLTAGLNAVHAYTWQDPASGCLKRSALIDELERRLAHPLTQPPTYCALIEIPTMRPSLSSLPGDELAVIQKRTGDMLLAALESGEHCGRLSDVTFMIVFAPQAPARVSERLARLKAKIEALHPEWKMRGAAVPLLDETGNSTPSRVLQHANQVCAPQRALAGFDLSCLDATQSPSETDTPLPFDALYLRCQKISACTEGAASHYEILLGVDETRVPDHTTQSLVVMAEQSGRIFELDTWVLKSAFEWMHHNIAALDQISGLSVNLSGASLTNTAHIDSMLTQIAARPDLAKKLIIEVTETAAIGNLDVAVRSLRKLRELECRVALDDFGSGYSSYGYLRRLPLDYLKIDGIYIRNILTDKTDQALTASMVDVAHALGLKVIAEYVDSEEACVWLKALGVDYVQGYWVHKPERLAGLSLH